MSETNLGAIYAISGFRKQFLYSLYRILSEHDKGLTFQPEGKFEDLDIKTKSGRYVETVQIKETNETLYFNKLFSKESSFYRRSVNAINNGAATVKIVCFGKLSEELKDGTLSIVEDKLLAKGFNSEEIRLLSKAYTFEEISEDTVTEKILKIIQDINLFYDAKATLDLLLFWLYEVAEKRQLVDTFSVFNKLKFVSKFLSERADFHSSFGKVIRSFELKFYDAGNEEKYKEGFYNGVSAKYEHILANVDILRAERIEEIKKGFDKSNVVFIHGASGQGKSTLAYRYINENISQFTSYELNISDNTSSNTSALVNSLDGLCKGLNIPVLLLIDISPQNQSWLDVIKEFYDKKNVYFLITIREEDWNKVVIKHHFNFSEVELNFTESEASKLYTALTSYKTDYKFVDFEESWKQAGSNAPLLEYVFLVTQGNTLKSRLEEQLRSIRFKVEKNGTKDLEILRFVCLADTYNSRTNYRKLATFLQIQEPVLYIDFFRKEYLLQISDDGTFLSGLHPIRSKLISEILFDNTFFNKTDYTDKLISLIDEQDIHLFLLHSFDNNYEIERCLNVLKGSQFNSYVAYNNIFKALLWKGIYDFTFTVNKAVFDELYQSFNGAWLLFLDVDYSSSGKEESISEILNVIDNNDNFQKGNLDKFYEINKKLSARESIYIYCKDWAAYINPPTKVNGEELGWSAYSELIFWRNHLNIQFPVKVSLGEIIDFMKRSNSLKCMSLILLAIKHKFDNDVVEEIETLNEYFIQELRKKFNILSFSHNDDKVTVNYFFDLVNQERYINSKENSDSNFAFKTTIDIIDLLRYAFPNTLQYEVRGYGHNFLGLEIHDESYKCISRDNLPLKFLTKLNSLMINLFDFSLKLSSWNEYIKHLNELRKSRTKTYKILKEGLVLIEKNEQKGIDYLTKYETILKSSVSNDDLSFPQSILDKWGYESNQRDEKGKEINNSSKFKKHKKFSEDYFNDSHNFVSQCFSEIVNVINKRRGVSSTENTSHLTELHIQNSLINLSKFQNEFDALFSKYYSHKENNKLKKDESNLLIELNFLWKSFINATHKSSYRAAEIRFQKTKLEFELKIHETFNSLRKRDDCLQSLHTYTNKRNIAILMNVYDGRFDLSIESALTFISEAFYTKKYTSIKNLLINYNFDEVLIIPLIHSKPLNNHGFSVPIFRVDKIRAIVNGEAEVTNPLELLTPKELETSFFVEKGLDIWESDIIGLKYWIQIIGVLTSFGYIINEVSKLLDGEVPLDAEGRDLLDKYQITIIDLIKSTLIDTKVASDYVLSNSHGFSSQLQNDLIYVMNFLQSTQETGKITFSKLDGYNNKVSRINEIYYGFADFLITKETS
ncbi:MAG: hypothetical protein ACJASM_002832 [Salibacteraceae bacterium]|jgi:hypothetical protein